ncbi:MAG: sulfate adenylyltransferase subunit 1 [Candidatus Dormibacteria bacterium]
MTSSTTEPGRDTIEDAPLLRIAAIGSVDDGKSTLIGRFLHDSKQLFRDQIQAVADASARRGVEGVELAYVTDGLKAEREQGITIDVAYRYAATSTRKLIIADCPGHVEYTRNMATGASTADAAVVVIDVEKGIREQTKRHLAIARLMGITSVVAAVNKMDRVGWKREPFESVATELEDFAQELGIRTTIVVPISALYGDNVVTHSIHASWYTGPSVFGAVDSLEAATNSHIPGGSSRLPVQWTIRSKNGGRAYAGMVLGDNLREGDTVTVLPRGISATVSAILKSSGPAASAVPGESVQITLAEDIDVSRGDTIATGKLPASSSDLEVTVLWFAAQPLLAGKRYILRHSTRETHARVVEIVGIVDLQERSIVPYDSIEENGIGVVKIQSAEPLVHDSYDACKGMGSLIFIDPVTGDTCGCGLLGVDTFAG